MGEIPAFLNEAKKRTLAKKSVEKMSEAWKRKTLRAELLFCQQFGKLFRDASFELEGDGFCIPFVSNHIALILKLNREVTCDRNNFRMFSDATQQALRDGMPAAQAEDFVKHLMSTATSVLDHFNRAVMSKMNNLMPWFQAAGLFEPQRFSVEWSKETFATSRPQWLDLLAGLKGVSLDIREALMQSWVFITIWFAIACGRCKRCQALVRLLSCGCGGGVFARRFPIGTQQLPFWC